ncbi:hypothetical protein HNQ91_002485 [Filimonas zeae]|uniref:Uncharacterized protein n=1 Tax=Filimonas zeae TaxID=1737353 RepID=A0A917IT16_9BACT|nr:hypothetical protein [Filimonas zeae]MDR6339434.1 hypothetical protein [Filimonas zeae]GGH63615.1 hypothetical protein GCM10011379_14730 [Filimonas zeae]
MAKQITSILLLLAFLLQTFSRTAIVLEFYANQQYIAQKLCENKNKPQLKCGGKCQLHKKLQQEESKDEENPERKLENKTEIFEPVPFLLPAPPDGELLKIQHTTCYMAHYPAGNVSAPFRPPSA